MKLAFIFLLVGYGTKAGLAPMHSWLPDAHSQAPAPVSALFSGFLLNAALYCIMRYLPLVEAATGDAGWGRQLLGGLRDRLHPRGGGLHRLPARRQAAAGLLTAWSTWASSRSAWGSAGWAPSRRSATR